MNNSNEGNKLHGESILDMIGLAAQFFQKLIPLDNMIGITDKEKFLYYYPGAELNVGDVAGKPIPEGGNTYEILKTGACKSGIVPKEVYGVPFRSIDMPIKDETGNIIGTIGLAISLKNQSILMEATEAIAGSSQQLAATSEEVALSAEALSKNVNDVLDHVQGVAKYIEETGKILESVNSIASSTKLLGLNAAIEASRAGESGRGFSIVADEIRKLSEDSSRSVKEIKQILDEINTNIRQLADKMNETSAITQKQASATQEIASSSQQLASCAQEIRKVAQVI